LRSADTCTCNAASSTTIFGHTGRAIRPW
jgi:hypothetical protein